MIEHPISAYVILQLKLLCRLPYWCSQSVRIRCVIEISVRDGNRSSTMSRCMQVATLGRLRKGYIYSLLLLALPRLIEHLLIHLYLLKRENFIAVTYFRLYICCRECWSPQCRSNTGLELLPIEWRMMNAQHTMNKLLIILSRTLLHANMKIIK